MMKRLGLFWLLLPSLVALAVVSAHAAPGPVPENLKLPPRHVTLLKAHATGTQIYVCQAKADDPATFEWTLKAPDADLLNEDGEKIGRHYAGPTWEGADGSRVVGEVVDRAVAPTPFAIPWLLLRVKATEGSGAFSTVTYIQRLETVGGVAPADGCSRTTAGAERAVPYQATYVFAYEAAD